MPSALAEPLLVNLLETEVFLYPTHFVPLCSWQAWYIFSYVYNIYYILSNTFLCTVKLFCFTIQIHAYRDCRLKDWPLIFFYVHDSGIVSGFCLWNPELGNVKYSFRLPSPKSSEILNAKRRSTFTISESQLQRLIISEHQGSNVVPLKEFVVRNRND